MGSARLHDPHSRPAFSTTWTYHRTLFCFGHHSKLSDLMSSSIQRRAAFLGVKYVAFRTQRGPSGIVLSSSQWNIQVVITCLLLQGGCLSMPWITGYFSLKILLMFQAPEFPKFYLTLWSTCALSRPPINQSSHWINIIHQQSELSDFP